MDKNYRYLNLHRDKRPSFLCLQSMTIQICSLYFWKSFADKARARASFAVLHSYYCNHVSSDKNPFVDKELRFEYAKYIHK